MLCDIAGLIVSERIFNLPPTLAYPLHQALFDEVCKARHLQTLQRSAVPRRATCMGAKNDRIRKAQTTV